MTPLRPSLPLPLRLSAHDRLQLELKTELLCGVPPEARARWVTDLWFVLPQATGIGPDGYRSEDFYEDLRAYTRLKSPVVPLAELVRPSGRGSPLAPLEQLARRAGGVRLTKTERATLLQESKLLCTVLKSQLRDWFADAPAPGADGHGPEEVARAAQLASRLEELVGHWRSVRDGLYSRALKKRCRDVLSYCDESVSLQVEQAALAQILAVPKPLRGEATDRLVALAKDEEAYRGDKGWRTTLDDGTPGKEFVDQVRLLKKYVNSVLHLHLRPARFDSLARQSPAAIAAALAMLWAAAAQIVMLVTLGLELQRGVSLGFLGTFTVAAVGAYVLKDRIKANAVTWVGRRLPALLDDRRQDLFLPDSELPIGRVAERMQFERSTSLPPEIDALRTSSPRAHLVLLADQDVLRYTRHVELRAAEAARRFPRLDGLSDILRLNVWRWIRTYARARKRVPSIDDDGTVSLHKVDNLYFVDVFVRLSRVEPLPATHLAHLRVVLNRRGLVDVEEVCSVA